MHQTLHSVCAAALGLCLIMNHGVASAQTATPSLDIKQPWARASIGAAPNGAAYFTITGGKTADKLIGAKTPVAARAELHTHIMRDNIMRMRQVRAVEIKPGAAVTLKPGGLHVMMLGLKRKLKPGETFDLTLMFEKAGARTIKVPVRKLGSQPAGMPGHKPGHMNHDMKPKTKPKMKHGK